MFMSARMIEWILPLQIQSPNIREHWTKGYKRNNDNKRILAAHWALESHKPTVPCVVSFHRLYNPSLHQKRMDAEENLRMAFKGIKDTIADLLIPGMAPGQADEGHGITWHYDQVTATKKGVRIIIQSQDEYERQSEI
jgi:hypothetical protein